jgi:hypothetical protein
MTVGVGNETLARHEPSQCGEGGKKPSFSMSRDTIFHFLGKKVGQILAFNN